MRSPCRNKSFESIRRLVVVPTSHISSRPFQPGHRAVRSFELRNTQTGTSYVSQLQAGFYQHSSNSAERRKRDVTQAPSSTCSSVWLNGCKPDQRLKPNGQGYRVAGWIGQATERCPPGGSPSLQGLLIERFQFPKFGDGTAVVQYCPGQLKAGLKRCSDTGDDKGGSGIEHHDVTMGTSVAS